MAGPERTPEHNPGSLIAIGRVRRPFGLQGQCYADAYGRTLPGLSLPAKIFAGRSQAEARPAVLLECKKSSNGFLCRFEAVGTVDAAGLMRGVFLFMERNSLRALADDEYYTFELEGMTVVTIPGDKHLGTVTEVLSYPTVTALTVQRENTPPLLICLRKEIVEKIDREARRIYVFETAIEQII